MENDEKLDDVELDEEIPEDDSTDYKAEAKKRDGIAKRYKTQAAKLKEELAQEKAKSAALAKNGSTSENKDNYAELSYLAVKGIESDDEIALVKEAMSDTGKSMREVVGSKWFQAQLKETREARATKEAIPSGTKRSSSSAKDSVDYWMNKTDADGKLAFPPRDQTELRRKVLDARIKGEKSKSQFTDTPVA